MKRLVLFYVLSLLVFSSTWAEKHPFSNGLYWELENGVLTISGNGAMEDYSNPWENEGTVEKVVIKNGVTSIGKCNFWEYNKPHHLKSVEIGSTVTTIGENAFDHCTGLTSVTIPNSVTSIGINAFSGCTGLTSVTIPNSVTSIGEFAFMLCTGLTSVTIPNSVTSIGETAFCDCTGLTSVSIPNSVTSIGEDAFHGCSNLIIESMPQWLIDKGEDEWRRCGLSEETVNGYINSSAIKKYGNYTNVMELKDGNAKYYKVSKGGHYGLTDKDGKVIVPAEMEVLEQAGAGYLRYKINDFYGVMNYSGKILIDTDRGYTKIGDYVSFTKRFPYEMDGYKGECNNLGVQVSKIKVATPQQNVATTNTTSNTSKNSTSSSGTTQTVVVEHHRDPVPVQQWQACWACGGMGTMGCDGCGGSGTKYIGDNLRRCGLCNGQGIRPCNICYGNKGQYITVYQ